MAQRDDQHQQGGYRDHREHSVRDQMDQYADTPHQYGRPTHAEPQGARNDHRDQRYGGRNPPRDLRHNDPTQASYGRFGAPDVHHQPSGGYGNERSQGESYGYGGYGNQGFNPDGSDHREQDHRYGVRGRDADRWNGDDPQDRGRFQGGSGGYASNTGVYASNQTYGGPNDQLGYGSNQGGRQQGHYDPDYHQWREEQMRNLDNDYHAWRGERYKKFSDDFGEWRRNRPAADAPGGGKGGTSEASSGAVSTSIGAGPGSSNTGTSGAK